MGDDARACLDLLDRGANVVTLAPDPDADPLDRAVEAWSAATRVHTPYFAHDADPLDAAADAWVRRFDGEGPIGELEVVVSDTLARWRAGSVELPDYYLVLDAETWAPTRKHWYLGVLHAAAPGTRRARARPGCGGRRAPTAARPGAGGPISTSCSPTSTASCPIRWARRSRTRPRPRPDRRRHRRAARR